MSNLYRNTVASPACLSYWTKVVEKDELRDQYVAGMVIDMTDKEHKAFVKTLTDLENDMRKEKGHEPVKVTTALKDATYDNQKVKVLKAVTKKDDFVTADTDGKPLKYNPWSTDKIRVACTPSYNDGSMNKNHQGLKLYLDGVKIVEKNREDGGDAGGGSGRDRAASLLDIDIPDEIETTPDTGDEFIF